MPQEEIVPTRGYSHYVLAILTVMYTFNYLDRYVLTILVVPIQQELHLSDTMMGFLLGPAFALVYTGLGIPVAYLADRYSRRTIIAVSLALWSAMTAASGLARTATQLAITRVGVGIGEAGGSAPAHSMISDYFPLERRAFAFGIFQQGVYIGQMLGLAVGGILVEWIGWRETFFAVGLPGLGVAVILHWTVKDPKRGSFDPKPVVAQSEPAAGIREVFRTLWRRPSFRALMVGGGIASFAGTGFGFWLPVLFERVHDMSRMEVGLIFGPVMAVSGSAGAIMAGLITDRLGKRDQRFLMWIPAASVFLSLPFLLGVCLWPTSFGAIVFAIPSGILGGGWAPAIYAAAQTLAPPRMRALAASLMILSITLVGMGAGPQVVGILNDVLASRFGDDAVRYSMAIVLATSVVGSLVLLLGARHLREDLRVGSVSS